MGRFTLNTFTALGLLLGALTIVSLVQRIAGVGLAPVLGEILEYYRWFLGTVKQYGFDWWTLRLFNVSIPLWAMDLISIWGLAIAGNFRVIYAQAILSKQIDGIRFRNTLDVVIEDPALMGLLVRARYFLVRQILFAPFEFVTRPFRRLARITRIAKTSRLSAGEIRRPIEGYGLIIRTTLRFERRLFIIQLLPALGALSFFVFNALVLAPQ